MLRFTKGLLKFPAPFSSRFFCTKEVFDFGRQDPFHQIAQSHTSCLVLHPVLYPNKGPVKELYLAEEAVGLAKALDWSIVKGPYWKESEDSELIEEQQTEEEPSSSSRSKNKDVYVPKEGDYVDAGVFKGIYHKGGIIVDMNSSEEEDDLYDEWKNELLRASIAKSSLIKVKQTNKVSFFGKGKVVELGEFVRENQVDAVFVNTELTGRQVRTLETRWNQIINYQTDNNEKGYDHQNEENEEDSEEFDDETEGIRKIKVFDRFTIILQIFAKRAQSRIAKLQIELAFLNYQKGKLMREGTTFSGYNIFSGDLMSANEIKLEVVSSKQRGALGKTGGEGETQLEIERRVISDKEAKIKRELLSETSSRQWLKNKRKAAAANTVPTIALIGYTNAGKSALMNKLTKANVESKNMLFQTLSTTSKKYRIFLNHLFKDANRLKLKSGQLGVLLDTIGFITNLPHDLVESFKCTLEEVQDADIVLHIRDISHPQTDDQKETVLDVLRELKFEESFYNKRMIEVWNKIDLLEEPIDYKKVAMSDVPIVPISATHGTNCDKLIDIVTTKINEIMGRKKIVMVHSPDHHKERLNWLYKNGNIANVEGFDYDSRPSKEYPYGKITFEVYLDEVTLRRYEATFGSKEGRKEREKLPDDWVKNSKSFFERRKEEQDRKKQMEQAQKDGEPKKLK